MYYRVAWYQSAIQAHPSPSWQWKSTVLSSLQTMLQFLRLYRALPQDRLRVFSSSSREDLEEQLVRENAGLGSPSVTAAHFLQERMIRSSEMTGSTSGGGAGEYQERAPLAVSTTTGWNESSRALHTAGEERGMSSLESRRLERERGAGGDHDVPYRFALPASMPQVLAWMRLLAKVQQEGFGPQA
jgi:hypothetical protein